MLKKRYIPRISSPFYLFAFLVFPLFSTKQAKHICIYIYTFLLGSDLSSQEKNSSASPGTLGLLGGSPFELCRPQLCLALPRLAVEPRQGRTGLLRLTTFPGYSKCPFSVRVLFEKQIWVSMVSTSFF